MKFTVFTSKNSFSQKNKFVFLHETFGSDSNEMLKSMVTDSEKNEKDENGKGLWDKAETDRNTIIEGKKLLENVVEQEIKGIEKKEQRAIAMVKKYLNLDGEREINTDEKSNEAIVLKQLIGKGVVSNEMMEEPQNEGEIQKKFRELKLIYKQQASEIGTNETEEWGERKKWLTNKVDNFVDSIEFKVSLVALSKGSEAVKTNMKERFIKNLFDSRGVEASGLIKSLAKEITDSDISTLAKSEDKKDLLNKLQIVLESGENNHVIKAIKKLAEGSKEIRDKKPIDERLPSFEATSDEKNYFTKVINLNISHYVTGIGRGLLEQRKDKIVQLISKRYEAQFESNVTDEKTNLRKAIRFVDMENGTIISAEEMEKPNGKLFKIINGEMHNKNGLVAYEKHLNATEEEWKDIRVELQEDSLDLPLFGSDDVRDLDDMKENESLNKTMKYLTNLKYSQNRSPEGRQLAEIKGLIDMPTNATDSQRDAIERFKNSLTYSNVVGSAEKYKGKDGLSGFFKALMDIVNTLKGKEGSDKESAMNDFSDNLEKGGDPSKKKVVEKKVVTEKAKKSVKKAKNKIEYRKGPRELNESSDIEDILDANQKPSVFNDKADPDNLKKRSLKMMNDLFSETNIKKVNIEEVKLVNRQKERVIGMLNLQDNDGEVTVRIHRIEGKLFVSRGGDEVPKEIKGDFGTFIGNFINTPMNNEDEPEEIPAEESTVETEKENVSSEKSTTKTDYESIIKRAENGNEESDKTHAALKTFLDVNNSLEESVNAIKNIIKKGKNVAYDGATFYVSKDGTLYGRPDNRNGKEYPVSKKTIGAFRNIINAVKKMKAKEGGNSPLKKPSAKASIPQRTEKLKTTVSEKDIMKAAKALPDTITGKATSNNRAVKKLNINGHIYN